ncbi:hypothetical protein SAMN02982919_00398 [Giesbergeria anulus]|uniref:Uncharacterized protein n=1 Tax=Giesbergeria anulus TaxID=180197 RepID=A0A1H9EXI0_9BURK|nr:hypothetical protein SAMN02982919_00398 [Giesbergeria anulus]
MSLTVVKSIVAKNTLAFLLDVFKLSTVDRPPQTQQDHQHQHHRQGNEQIQDVHRTPSIG